MALRTMLPFLLLAILQFTDVTSDFVFGFHFNDNIDEQRAFIIDSTSPSSFVLDFKKYHTEAGAENTFFSERSKTFHQISPFHSINYKTANSSAKVTASLGRDQVAVMRLPLNIDFAIARRIDGTLKPAIDTKGRWMAGRLGIGRGKDKTTVKDELMKASGRNIICGQAWISEEGLETMIVVGGDPANVTKYSQATVVPKEPTLWKIPLSGFTVNGSTHSIEKTLIISTSIDKILVPPNHFENVLKLLHATQNGTKYQVDCNTSYEMAFTTNGKQVPVEYEGVLERNGDTCFLKIDKNDEDNFVYGIPLFLNKEICFYYDRNEVVFYHSHGVPQDAGAFSYRNTRRA